MSYTTEKYTGILKEILGEEKRYIPSLRPREIILTKIRMQLNDGADYETMVLNRIPAGYKNKQITLEEKSKVKRNGTEIFKEKLSAEKMNSLVASVKFNQNRIVF